jgi:hypothetical protein
MAAPPPSPPSPQRNLGVLVFEDVEPLKVLPPESEVIDLTADDDDVLEKKTEDAPQGASMGRHAARDQRSELVTGGAPVRRRHEPAAQEEEETAARPRSPLPPKASSEERVFSRFAGRRRIPGTISAHPSEEIRRWEECQHRRRSAQE